MLSPVIGQGDNLPGPKYNDLGKMNLENSGFYALEDGDTRHHGVTSDIDKKEEDINDVPGEGRRRRSHYLISRTSHCCEGFSCRCTAE